MGSEQYFESECLAAYGSSVMLYRAAVVASLALALFSISIRHVCLRDLLGAPGLAAQFYFVIGILQLLIAVMVTTVFLPHCPEICLDFCSNKYKATYFVYPVFATTLGVLLCREGWIHHKKAYALQGADGGRDHGDIAVFHSVPMEAETEMQ
jgi:hypothetical protein